MYCLAYKTVEEKFKNFDLKQNKNKKLDRLIWIFRMWLI